MRQNEWQGLGQALRDLRMARDLDQQEAIDHLGEQMGVRTLRAYELGEQRPRRDRLLRLLINSFEQRNGKEIDRHLQLAKYALLSKREIQRYGLEVAAPSDGRPGPPVDFRIEVSTLAVVDGQGREVWRHQFPTRLTRSAYGSEDVRHCVFADIDNDGGVEALFVFTPLDFATVGATLFCFREDGSIKWQFVPGKPIRDTRQEYHPPYFISNVQIIPSPDSLPRILVSSNHYAHNPNQIAMLDTNGKLISEYWHSGHLLSVVHADLNDDGVDEILLAGVNNGYRQATMVVFDSRNVNGASTQPGRQILGFPAGTEKAVVLFPKTCLAKNAPYNRVAELRRVGDRRILLAVAEGVSETQSPGLMLYELDYGLKVLSARPDSHFYESHRTLELQGLLDHPWTEEENEQLKRQVVVQGSL
jgi:transcriptional regulator with XRE-family HTH domain